MTEVLYRRIAEPFEIARTTPILDVQPPTWKEERWLVNRDPHTSQRLDQRRRDT
jgi:hypothetical protein